MKGPSKDVIRRVIESRGWFWADHNRGLARPLRELEREGKAVLRNKNKHGAYWVRPGGSE